MFKSQFSFGILVLGVLTACSSNPEPEKTPANKPPISVNGIANVEEYYENGVVKLKGKTMTGKRIGKWEAFYPNGYKWSETNYQNGLKEGITSSYFQNGLKRYQGQYTLDYRSGLWQFYDSTGALISQMNMDTIKTQDVKIP